MCENAKGGAVTRAAGIISVKSQGGSMIRFRFAGILLAVIALCASSAVFAQTKESSSKAPKKAAMKPLDINSASEEEIASAGIDRAVAKKIVQGRPYRNKTELVSRQILSREQYDKLKDGLVAKQLPKLKAK
jgi:DNA uptake protein ComE-like DNA-binding protein